MYSKEIADRICAELIEGKSLRAICAHADMPAKSTVLGWLKDNAIPGFLDQYTRARELQADTIVDEILEIADDDTGDMLTGAVSVSRAKLRIDSRKWTAGKLAPKKYGDSKQVDITSKGERVTGFAIVDYAEDDS